MKQTALMLLALALVTPEAKVAKDITAEHILQRVRDTYRTLRSFRLVEILDGRRTDVAEDTPGKVRLEQPGVLLVSNGETTWTYLRDRNQFRETAAAPLLLRGTWQPSPFVLQPDIGLSRQKRHAKLRGEGRLDIGGRGVECYIVSFPSPTSGTHRVWVDKQRFIVWRDDWLGPPSEYDIGDFAYGAGSSSLESLDAGPLPADLFEFTPPKGARRVDDFGPTSIPKKLPDQAWQAHSLANLLLGTDSWMLGRRAPDFAVQSLEGKLVRLRGLRDKIVLLDFCATWCRRCQKELADIQKLHEELASQDVVLLGIDDEDSDTVTKFAQANGYTFPILLDTNHAVQELYGAQWVPTVVVINRKGKIAARYVGAGGEAELRRHLEIAGLKPSAAP